MLSCYARRVIGNSNSSSGGSGSGDGAPGFYIIFVWKIMKYKSLLMCLYIWTEKKSLSQAAAKGALGEKHLARRTLFTFTFCSARVGALLFIYSVTFTSATISIHVDEILLPISA